MSMYSFFSAPPSVSPFFESKFKSKPLYGDNRPVFVRACADVPDFLSAEWLESRRKRPLGPRLNFSAEEAVQYQLDALKFNDQPYQDHGIEVMYRFAGFDPFERSTYFGPFFDLGQFERFRRIFHHSTYRVLLGHKEKKMLSSLIVKENRYKQRVWVRGSRPEEEEIFQFTMVQVGKLRFSLEIAIDVSDNGGSLNLSLHLTKPLLNDHLSAFLTAVIVRFGYCKGSKNNMS